MTGVVNARSKLLFNGAHVLTVSHAIAVGDGVVDARSLQHQLGLRQSAVQRILVTLEGVGLLERLERGARTDPQRFHRVTHSFWAAATELAHA